ncbi:DNA primase [Sphingomonas sp. ASV193]|uniref:DNA primase n=1 Tax=Sphingomonas sp. ASV193 TaxID=3144405 RepID=UPI0032E89B29
MTLSPQWLDELRARTLLSAVISPSVKLTKAGREFKACCPFHNEKTPSFTVNDDKGFYHCFGCGAHGDAIRFLTDARGLPFIDAVKELAAKAGIEVPAGDPRDRERADRAAGLHDVMASAQRWFAEQLAGIEGGEARAYLAKRGIDARQVERFGIGFAPDSRGKLKAALAALGEERLVDTGLLVRPDEGKATYDRFRGRLMIPIRDQRGRVIGFGGRILGAGEPKYLNSPETVLFDKGRTLYNIDLAGPASRKAGRVVVVEGYMDVIALDRAGIGEAVAPNGTALTEDQLQRLWRLDPAPILCFDGDSAGQKAAIRAIGRALPHLGPDRTLSFVTLPEGQDPDDLVRSGGRAALDTLIDVPEPLVDRLWRHETAAQPLATPEARAGLKARLLAHAGAIADPNVRQLYRDEFLRRFDLLVRPNARRGAGPRPFAGSPQRDGRRSISTRFVPETPPGEAARAIADGGIDRPTARALVLGHALYPSAIGDHVEALAALPLADAPAARVRDLMVDLAMNGQPLDRETLLPILAGEGTASAWRDVKRGGGIGFSFTRPDADAVTARRDLALAVDTLLAADALGLALSSATERLGAGDDSAFDEQVRLHAEYETLKDRLASLAGNE